MGTRGPDGLGGSAVIGSVQLTEWLAARVPGLAVPVGFDLVASGRSNLTYRLTGADGRTFVLRRPPTSGVSSTAHDMEREWRFLVALTPTGVPVPEPVALCTDPSVLGGAFYVMSHVDGLALDEPGPGRRLAPAARARAGRDVVDVLVRLHELDPVRVGLGDLLRPEGYVERQLRRWRRQIAGLQLAHAALIEEVHQRLAARVPPQVNRLVHGDYRPGNALFGLDGTLRAVLDWELATTGDPLADLGWLLSTWQEPGEKTPATTGGPSTVAGYGSRSELVARYAAWSGRDVSDLPYYVAFSRWRSSCILAGVAARYRAGAVGGDRLPPDVAARIARSEDLVLAAREALLDN